MCIKRPSQKNKFWGYDMAKYMYIYIHLFIYVSIYLAFYEYCNIRSYVGQASFKHGFILEKKGFRICKQQQYIQQWSLVQNICCYSAALGDILCCGHFSVRGIMCS